MRRSDDSVVGVLLTKDIFGAMLSAEPAPWENLRQHLRDPLLVPESVDLSRVMEQMRRRRMHMAMIVDEYGQMSGVVTLEDLLEENTGEIQDETDTAEEVHYIRELAEGRWEADGLTPLANVERMIGSQLEHDAETNTLTGMFMDRLDRLPLVGDTLEVSGFRLSVLSVDQRRAGRVGIDKQPENC